jgi:hypothetical protein
MEKYWRTSQATDDNMAHAHCMLATNTRSEYVIRIASSSVKMVTRTRLNVTLYVHRLSFWFFLRISDDFVTDH